MKFISSFLSKRWNLPGANLAQAAVGRFSLTERVLFWLFAGVFIVSGLFLLLRVNNAFLVEVPDYGGSLSEGIIGVPRFINPLLALSEADKDMTALIFSGLMKAMPDGSLVVDLADHYTVSEDSLTYTFTLKDNLFFHNGARVTADDVVFTVERAQDPALKSPRRGNWDGITVEKVSEREVRFILPQPYAPFLENTTLGILPRNLWKDASADEFSFNTLNVEPIGSGPYQVADVKRDKTGIPTLYTLKSFSKYTLGKPFIQTITMRFYQNEEALKEALDRKEIESASGFSASTAHILETEGAHVESTVLPRTFAVFFNQNQAPVFRDNAVRSALDVALNKEAIVSEVLYGYGTALSGPVPPRELDLEFDVRTTEERMAQAREILKEGGWSYDEEAGTWSKEISDETTTLAFSLATGDTPELKAAAEHIQSDWAMLGVNVDLKIFESGDLNQTIIRPRRYDALLFGEVVGRSLDFYPFWHSSQRNDPGLNIALYVNTSVDGILEEARATLDLETKESALAKFEAEIRSDQPAAFVYAPSFLYVIPENVKNVKLGQMTAAGERFSVIHTWYRKTNKVWNIFVRNTTDNL